MSKVWLADLPSIKKEVNYMKAELEPFREHQGEWGVLREIDTNTTQANLNSMGSTLRRNYTPEFLFAVRGNILYAKFVGV